MKVTVVVLQLSISLALYISDSLLFFLDDDGDGGSDDVVTDA
jgi:hypothetical protein